MNKLYITLLLFCQISLAQEITLNHNIGTNIIDQLYNPSCTGGGVDWARVFVLEDFGVTGAYTINSGSFAIEEANNNPGEGVTINVYAIDEDFPNTFDETALLGSSDLIDIPFTNNTIFPFDFATPIVIPAEVDIILVEVSLAFQTQNVFMGGTMDSFDFSWIKTPSGCLDDFYQSTFDLGHPDTNYYITVTGDHLLNISENKRLTVSLSPNPVFEILRIEIPSEISPNELTIFDINGQSLYSGSFKSDVDVSTLSSGVYFLKVNSSEGSLTRKFLKR